MLHYTNQSQTFIKPGSAPGTKELRMDESFIYPEILNAEVLWMTNQQRIKYGLRTLEFSEGLQRMATIHSQQMQQHQFFSHENPYDRRLRTLSDRINAAKDSQLETFRIFGENIAKYPMLKAGVPYSVRLKAGKPHFHTRKGELLPYTCTEFARAVVEGWMNSPGHRANILNPNFEFIGCGCSRIAKRQKPGYNMIYYIMTQNFGGRMTQKAGPFDTHAEIRYLVTGKYKYPLIGGQVILRSHLAGCQNSPYAKIGLLVERNGLLGIKNLSPYTWTVAQPGNRVRLLPPGGGMPVRHGLRIRAGNQDEWSVII